MLIREIRLENFMSYKYARISLKPGLNIICGPNGSGKSSILLALSVVLGQTHTERSRRLSDLIRWGEDVARVTLVFDNAPKDGVQPFPKYKTDYFQLSRYLRKDGTYWYEANFRSVLKDDLVRLLSKRGINPDNMFIIMHQNMVGEFGATTPQEKLTLTEDAVGFHPYRQKIVDAKTRLLNLMGEEKSISKLLEEAEQTLAYWKEEYEKYKRRMSLIERGNLLERELAWSRVARQEKTTEAWSERIQDRKEKLKGVVMEMEKTKNNLKSIQENLDNLKYEERKSFYSLLDLEKNKTGLEVKSTYLRRTIDRVKTYRKTITDGLEKFRTHTKNNDNNNPMFDPLERVLIEDGKLAGYLDEMSNEAKSSDQETRILDERIRSLQTKLGEIERKLNSTTNDYISERVRGSLLDFKKENLENECHKLDKELRNAEKELNQLKALAEKYLPRVETTRDPDDIQDEIRLTNAYLASVGKVSEDAEKMYLKYSDLCGELKKRALIVSENRDKALKEIESRIRVWREAVSSILQKISLSFNNILSEIGASGRVGLTNAEDMESAGLELLVGFQGMKPTVLDAYTQSGGERSTALMAFLLSLQQYIQSPVRAIDEFDIHMDPRNKEVITQALLSAITTKDYQYIAITPSQITNIGKDVHVITVQNIQGKSEVKVVAKSA